MCEGAAAAVGRVCAGGAARRASRVARGARHQNVGGGGRRGGRWQSGDRAVRSARCLGARMARRGARAKLLLRVRQPDASLPIDSIVHFPCICSNYSIKFIVSNSVSLFNIPKSQSLSSLIFYFYVTCSYSIINEI